MNKTGTRAPGNDEPEIVYEDKNFLGVYKPSGLIVHPINAKNVDEPSLSGWLLKKYPEIKKVGDEPETRPGIVHRLDKETSGIIVIPRNQEYFDYLKNLFKTRQIKKTYLALVAGELKESEGIIDKPIGIKTGSVKRSVHSEKMKKSAVTRYKVKKTFYGEPGRTIGSERKKVSLLEVFPETGRTHQIRVHLASIGHPILGDKLYGGKKSREAAARLMLHAYSIEFSSPSGSRIKLEVEPGHSFSV